MCVVLFVRIASIMEKLRASRAVPYFYDDQYGNAGNDDLLTTTRFSSWSSFG